MLIALNVVIFSLGFAAALLTSVKPNYNKSDLTKLLHQFRAFLNQLRNSPGETATNSFPSILQASRRRSFDEQSVKLLTKDDVERQYDTSTWQRLAYEDLKSTILAKGAGTKTFPCVYATMGYRSNDHRYVFLESDNPAEARNVRIIAPALQRYLYLSKSLGPNTSLVIIGAPSPSPKSVDDYNSSFWDMLHGLRIRDSEPWPSDIPQDTQSEKWTFCFNGEPLFPVSLSPAHQRRWSRHASVPVIALQPKWVLDNLLSTPEKRKAATGKVRKLLAEYDQVKISPDLTSYGEPGTSEIHQLCLRDENTTALCPYQDFDR